MNYNYNAYNEWVGDNGDETLRLNYKLTNESVVVDAGGYHGTWSERIFNLYNPNVFILEPIKKYYNDISNKFSNNEKIKVLNYGLSSKKDELEINLDNDGSSIFKSGSNKEKIIVTTIDEFLTENNIPYINLLKINIEGSEYDLLEDILSKGIQNKIENIQVQFHVFIDNCESRRNKIREQLSLTHECTYNYDFIWENWEIKK